jgi:SAM-dependent methyltransferase
MTRPAPLFEGSDLVRLLSGPLDTHSSSHGRFLANRLTGRTLVVAQTPEDRDRFSAVADGAPDVTSVTSVLNDTSTPDDVAAHSLPEETEAFDTILYAKHRTQWFARSSDFQRLTALLRPGGTLLSCSKWVPDSDRLALKEIAIANADRFQLPTVYLAYTKTKTTLGSFATPDDDADNESPARSYEGSRFTIGGDGDVDALGTQFRYDHTEREYSPGWSWHSPLIAHVDDWLSSVTGPTANLCCGTNSQGDIRVDLLTEYTPTNAAPGETAATAATVQGDAFQVPLATDSVQAVLMDPPWKIPRDDRVRLFSEAHRITEPGGRILHNAWWLPGHPYGVEQRLWPVVANVTDSSIGGPAGLSWLAELEVAEQPDHPDLPYTLADHMDRHGFDHLTAYRDWHRRAPPTKEPMNDPRILGATACWRCETPRYAPHRVHGRVVYECLGCGYRLSPLEALDPPTSDPIDDPEPHDQGPETTDDATSSDDDPMPAPTAHPGTVQTTFD